MNERIKVNVKVSSEVNTILHDLFNQIQYEYCEQYEEEIERLNNELQIQIEDNARLNEYIEEQDNIIKEDKKIEKLELVSNGSTNSYALLNEYGTKCGLTKHSKIMCDKINEIIDKINKGE